MHCWWEFKSIQPLWKTVWRFLKKAGIKPTYDPTIPLPGIYPEEAKIEKETCTPMFTAALFIIARTWNQPRCPLTDEWIKKLWYIYTMECYSAIKRNTSESILMGWMNQESIIHSEVIQKKKDKYHVLTHICGSRKMVLMNLFAKQQWRKRHREQIYGHRGRGGDGEMYGESNMETYITMGKIDSQWQFAV